jgi:hypothetical protein
MKRIDKCKPDMSLDDVLALILPELSPAERKKTNEGQDWSGGTGVGSYLLDDYWQAMLQLKNFDKPQLIETPKLVPYVRVAWIKPADNFTGLWVTWHVNGQKAHEDEYRGGKYDGTSLAFYNDGSKAYQQHYKQHICIGAETGWFRSGEKAYEGQYKDGKQDGTWRHWYENGQLASETNYKMGETYGKSTSWFENGQIRYLDFYQNGKREGRGAAWDVHGKVLWDRTYRDDSVVESN